MDKLLFAEDLAERYRVSERKARELLREMPAIRIGARRAVTEAALRAWEMEKTQQPATVKRGRKAKTRTVPVVHLSEMRCPTRKELREMEARTKAAR